MARLHDIVGYGYRLASDGGCAEPRLCDAVWELLVEAFATLKGLPDKERGWLLACERSHHPEVTVEDVEVAEWLATLDALSLKEKIELLGDVHIAPDKGAIDRMDEVLTWPAAIKTKTRRRDRGVLVFCAIGAPTMAIRHRFGIKHRNTLYDIRSRALAHVSVWIDERLKKLAGQTVQTVHIVHPNPKR